MVAYSAKQAATKFTNMKMALFSRFAEIGDQAPWLFDVARFAFRITQARFSAGVIGVVLNASDQILVVKHRFHPKTPWGLPGGWLEAGEQPSACLRRELQEELGMEADVIQPLAINAGGYFRQHLDIAFLCRALNDVSRLDSELLAYRWGLADMLSELAPFHQDAVRAFRKLGQTRGI